MNIKTVASAYFIPITRLRHDGESYTNWLNLARVQNVIFNHTKREVRIEFGDDESEEYGESAYEVLLLELTALRKSRFDKKA